MEDLKGDEGIVFRLHDESGHADSFQELVRRLSGVVMLSVAESEGGRGDFVVDREDGAQAAEVGGSVASGRDEARAHAAHEAALVDTIVDASQAAGAGEEVDGGRHGAGGGNKRACALA